MHIKDEMKYHITVRYKGVVLEFPMENGIYHIGGQDGCLFQNCFEDSDQIYSLRITSTHVVLKSFDPKFPIVIGSKEVAEVIISETESLLLGELEFDLEFHDQTNQGITPITEKTLSKVGDEQQLGVMSASSSFIRVNGDVDPESFTTLVKIDGLYCDIVFDEEHGRKIKNFDSIDIDFNIRDFIDVEVPPTSQENSEPYEEGTVKSIEVTHFHNGSVLFHDFYDYGLSEVFASNRDGDYKTAILSCLDDTRSILLTKNKQSERGQFSVNSLPGYQLTIWKGCIESATVEEGYASLEKDMAIVLTRGLEQIVIRESFIPPTLDKGRFFLVEKKRMALLIFLFLLLLLPAFFLASVPEAPKKLFVKKKKPDVIIIYKKNSFSRSAMSSAKNGERKVKPKKIKKKVSKKLAKKTSAKVRIAKTPKASTSKSKNVTQNNIKVKRKPVVKTYSFNTSSKIKDLLGTSKSIPSKVVDNSKSYVAKGITGKRFVKSSGVGDVEDINIGVKKFNESETGGVETNYGTSGLSDKSGMNSAYIESRTKVLGAIDPLLISKILKEYIPQFRYCYHRELRNQPEVEGIFDLEFKINTLGRGSDVKIVTNKKSFSASTKTCISNVVALIKFPKVKGGGFVEVVQPLNFLTKK